MLTMITCPAVRDAAALVPALAGAHVPRMIPARRSVLLPGLPAPLRWTLGMGLLTVSLWLPAFVAIFR